MTGARVVVEAEGGSRGNPGPAAYGALLRDADSGQVLATKAETIGIATNNVAEYSGLIAGLELANEFAPDAELEVRMDSKLVIEQMAGRWKIKHADMKPLALRAQRELAGRPVVWTWVPREQNKDADALANAALDGKDTSPAALGAKPAKAPTLGWSSRFTTTPTTIILVRHGATEHTERKLFSGSGGDDPVHAGEPAVAAGDVLQVLHPDHEPVAEAPGAGEGSPLDPPAGVRENNERTRSSTPGGGTNS